MVKVLLIAPSERSVLSTAGDRPPLGILYIASALKKDNHLVEVCDMNYITSETLAVVLRDFNPDFVGVSFTTPLFIDAIKIKTLVRENCKAKIIAGGPHPSACPESCKGFDFVVVGEGEEAILEIVNDKNNLC